MGASVVGFDVVVGVLLVVGLVGGLLVRGDGKLNCLAWDGGMVRVAILDMLTGQDVSLWMDVVMMFDLNKNGKERKL